jgi:hypothetical protein
MIRPFSRMEFSSYGEASAGAEAGQSPSLRPADGVPRRQPAQAAALPARLAC